MANMHSSLCGRINLITITNQPNMEPCLHISFSTSPAVFTPYSLLCSPDKTYRLPLGQGKCRCRPSCIYLMARSTPKVSLHEQVLGSPGITRPYWMLFLFIKSCNSLLSSALVRIPSVVSNLWFWKIYPEVPFPPAMPLRWCYSGWWWGRSGKVLLWVNFNARDQTLWSYLE